ncbi:MAG TPA: hypothetical protein VFS76_01560 [Pyrinomonadaceae bacterium]|nr:hypothetical protein [Pyrinomonadaceae bacterium]
MVTDTSATMRHETPHANRITKTATILNALKQRAQAVVNDTSIDPQSRAIIRYAMEINDPWLAKLVRRADEGETELETIDFSQTPDTLEQDLSDKRVRALAEMICRDGNEPETKAAALLVLMSSIEDSAYPKSLANTAKDVAFARCGELNLYGMVEAQVATVEHELFANVV